MKSSAGFDLNSDYDAVQSVNYSTLTALDPFAQTVSREQRVVTKSTRKLIIGFLNKIMNQVVFLKYMEAPTIFNLSMCNKKFRKFLDPLHQHDRGRRNPRLARVAAIQYLPDGDKLPVR